MKALGTDDSITTCDCYGRSNLKFTVIIQLDCGDLAHYGSVCATRNTGKSQSVISSEIKAEALRVRAEAGNAYRSTDEYVAYERKLAARPRTLIGRAAADFVRSEGNAADAARAMIAAKFGLQSCEVQA